MHVEELRQRNKEASGGGSWYAPMREPNGERQDADVLGDHVFDTNILTVIASESYDDFAKKLQTEMAEACADRPIIITPNLFEGKPYTKADGTNGRFDLAQARDIYDELVC